METRAMGQNANGALTVKDVMTHLVASFRPGDSLTEAAKKMTRNRISGGPVVSAGKVIGVLSEADIARSCAPKGPWDQPEFIRDPVAFVAHRKLHDVDPELTVKDVMTEKVVTVGPDVPVWEAAALLDRFAIRRLPVVADDGFLIGILARADIVRAVARSEIKLSAAPA